MRDSKDRFFIKFRGVRGSYPTPYAGFLKYGGNTSCVEVNVNGHTIILDAGTGIIKCGEELDNQSVTVLLSHFHNDHIQGLPFFKPIYKSSSKVNIAGFPEQDEKLESVISELLFEKSFPVSLKELGADISFYESCDVLVLGSDAPERVSKDYMPKDSDVVITCFKSNTHPRNGVMIYKISYKNKSVVYATDTEYSANDELADFAHGTDLLIHDSQYTSDAYLKGYGHSTFDMSLEISSKAQAKSLAFFHLNPHYSDEFLLELENHYTNNCFIAKEGQEIVII
jgi:ribonuclease BN (tRNA processing enzyme)